MRRLVGDELLDGGEGGLGRVVVAEDSEARGPRACGEPVAQAEPFVGLHAGAAGEHETLHPTSAGAGALAERVEAEVRGGDLTGGPSSVAALAYLSIMPPRRAARALRARATAIGDEARQLQEALDGAGTAEIHMIEVHYLLSRLQHDMQWLTGTAHRIETGELTWPLTRRLPASHRGPAPERDGMAALMSSRPRLPAAVENGQQDDQLAGAHRRAQITQFGRPYFVPTMQRATPGILTLPSCS